MGGLINVIEVVVVYAGKKEKARMRSKKYARYRGVLRCDFACFHEAKIIAPFGQINEDSGTCDIYVAFPQVATRGEKEKYFF